GKGDDVESEEGSGLPPPKKGNPALVWGSIGGLVVVAAAAILVLNKSTPAPVKPAEAPGTGAAAVAPGAKPATAPAMGPEAARGVLNVYYTVNAGETFDKPSGAMKAAIADRVLRGIDGWYDRRNHGRAFLLTARTEAKDILYVARAWFGWWDNEAWKTPVKP